jgi:hypothetical protein
MHLLETQPKGTLASTTEAAPLDMKRQGYDYRSTYE